MISGGLAAVIRVFVSGYSRSHQNEGRSLQLSLKAANLRIWWCCQGPHRVSGLMVLGLGVWCGVPEREMAPICGYRPPDNRRSALSRVSTPVRLGEGAKNMAIRPFLGGDPPGLGPGGCDQRNPRPTSDREPLGTKGSHGRMAWVIARVDLGEVAYDEAMTRMAGWVSERREGLAGDRLFLLSHPPVITVGPRTAPSDLPPGLELPTVQVDRGGYATYHGPGQLVGYLIVGVRERGPGDIVRWLENGLITALRALGFDALRRDTPSGASSLVGVWTPEHHKVASIGMRIRQGISSHGFALNVDPDLTAFGAFTACGLHDVTTTSLREMAGVRGVRTPTDAEVRDAVATALGLHRPSSTPR